MEREVTKEEFKELFFRYGVAQPDSGWTECYWRQIHENETSARYFFTELTSPAETRMFITSGRGAHRMYLMSEEAEESLFGP
ncbi:MAG: hypothetical protein R2729_06985 [Bryobacteraceae bacterium]